MKRLAAALLGGFLIPLAYSLIAAPLSSYITNPNLDRLIQYPVRWPILIFYRLGFLPFSNEFALLSYLVISNVLLYSILTYVLLTALSSRKRAATHSPPKPPSFV